MIISISQIKAINKIWNVFYIDFIWNLSIRYFVYKIQNLKVMVIFLIWVGLICCGVANGLIFDHVQAPQSYYYMGIATFMAVILLLVHRIYTRKWSSPFDATDPHHPMIFGGSSILFFFVMICSLLGAFTEEVTWGFFIGCLTMFISFAIALTRERQYV